MKRTLMIKALVLSALGTMPLQVLAAEHTIITGTEFATVLAATTHTASLTSTGITAVEGNIISNNTVTANGTLHGGGMVGGLVGGYASSVSNTVADAWVRIGSMTNNIFANNTFTGTTVYGGIGEIHH